MKIPENLLYAESHEWIKKDGNKLIVGISDYAQDKLGDIVFIDFLVDTGDAVEKGDPFAELESVKAVESVYAPVTGTVTSINTALDDDYSVINEDCYGDGWLIKIDPADASALDGLLKSDEYKNKLEE